MVCENTAPGAVFWFWFWLGCFGGFGGFTGFAFTVVPDAHDDPDDDEGNNEDDDEEEPDGADNNHLGDFSSGAFKFNSVNDVEDADTWSFGPFGFVVVSAIGKDDTGAVFDIFYVGEYFLVGEERKYL